MVRTILINAIDPVAISFFNLNIRWYGIIIATAILISVILATKEAKRKHLNVEYFYDVILWSVPVALVSARIYYVFFQWEYYQNHLDQIISIWNGGIAIYGALMGVIVFVVIFCKIKNLSAWKLLDVLAPYVLMSQGIGRWGNFVNQEAYGKIVNKSLLLSMHLPKFMIDQMHINGFYRNPTFLYESFWDLVGFVIILLLRRHQNIYKNGEVFLSYVGWYAFGRFFIEGMRTDSLMLGHGIRISQLVAIVTFMIATVMFIVRRKILKVNFY